MPLFNWFRRDRGMELPRAVQAQVGMAAPEEARQRFIPPTYRTTFHVKKVSVTGHSNPWLGNNPNVIALNRDERGLICDYYGLDGTLLVTTEILQEGRYE